MPRKADEMLVKNKYDNVIQLLEEYWDKMPKCNRTVHAYSKALYEVGKKERAYEECSNPKLQDRWVEMACLSDRALKERYIAYDERMVRWLEGTRKERRGNSVVTLTMTTCKRLDLFERTVNSFLQCCMDVHKIGTFLVVDDNSSEEDRLRMKRLYPFCDFIFKEKEQKGHAQSMNMIIERVREIGDPFVFHMEDDWMFYRKDDYVTKCIEVLLEGYRYGQCLVNVNYGEEPSDYRIEGEESKRTFRSGIWYVEHKMDKSGAFTGPNCRYWPGYSLRPGMTRRSVFENIGYYNEKCAHFELEYSERCFDMGYITTFLDQMSAEHIGRLTRERHTQKENAYLLNGQAQFGEGRKNGSYITEFRASATKGLYKSMDMYVVSLKSRKDRLDLFYTSNSAVFKELYIADDIKPIEAVDGSAVKVTDQLLALFNRNDFSWRVGLVGCALSHLRIYDQFLRGEAKVAMVFEDDATCTDAFVQWFRELDCSLFANGIDLLYLGYHCVTQQKEEEERRKKTKVSYRKWSVGSSLRESLGGTFAYMITRKGAELLLAYIEKHGIKHGIDTVQQKAADALSIWVCDPVVVTSPCYRPQNAMDVDTDIQRNYSTLDKGKTDIRGRLAKEIDWFKRKGIVFENVSDEQHVPKNGIAFVLAKDGMIDSTQIDITWECYDTLEIGETVLLAVPKSQVKEKWRRKRYFSGRKILDCDGNIDLNGLHTE